MQHSINMTAAVHVCYAEDLRSRWLAAYLILDMIMRIL
jgi:hypothetical protein